MNKELIESSKKLYSDIDACIDELLKARVEHDTEAEGKALFKMEGLMVATLQQLSCVIDEQPSIHINLDEAAEKFAYTGIPESTKSVFKPIGDKIIEFFKTGAMWAMGQFEPVKVKPADAWEYRDVHYAPKLEISGDAIEVPGFDDEFEIYIKKKEK